MCVFLIRFLRTARARRRLLLRFAPIEGKAGNQEERQTDAGGHHTRPLRTARGGGRRAQTGSAARRWCPNPQRKPSLHRPGALRAEEPARARWNRHTSSVPGKEAQPHENKILLEAWKDEEEIERERGRESGKEKAMKQEERTEGEAPGPLIRSGEQPPSEE